MKINAAARIKASEEGDDAIEAIKKHKAVVQNYIRTCVERGKDTPKDIHDKISKGLDIHKDDFYVQEINTSKKTVEFRSYDDEAFILVSYK